MNRNFSKILVFTLAVLLVGTLGFSANADAQTRWGLTTDATFAGGVPANATTAGDTVALNGYTLTMTTGVTAANLVILFNDSTNSGNTAGDSELLLADGDGGKTVGQLCFQANGIITITGDNDGDSLAVISTIGQADSLGGHRLIIGGVGGAAGIHKNSLGFWNVFKMGGGEIQYDNTGKVRINGLGKFVSDLDGSEFDINQIVTVRCSLLASSSIYFDLAAKLSWDTLGITISDSMGFRGTSEFELTGPLELGNSGGIYAFDNMTFDMDSLFTISGVTATPSFFGVATNKELTVETAQIGNGALTIGAGEALTIYGPGIFTYNDSINIENATATLNLSTGAKVDSVFINADIPTPSSSTGLRILSDTCVIDSLLMGGFNSNIYLATGAVCSTRNLQTGLVQVATGKRVCFFGTGKWFGLTAIGLHGAGLIDFRGGVTVDSVLFTADGTISNAQGIKFSTGSATITEVSPGLEYNMNINTGSGGTITNALTLATAAHTLWLHGTGLLTMSSDSGLVVGGTDARLIFAEAARISKVKVTAASAAEGDGIVFNASGTISDLFMYAALKMDFTVASITATISDSFVIPAGTGFDLYGSEGADATLAVAEGVWFEAATGDLTIVEPGITVSNVGALTDMTAVNSSGILFVEGGTITNIDTASDGAKNFNIVVTSAMNAHFTNDIDVGHASISYYGAGGTAGKMWMDSTGMDNYVNLNTETSAFIFQTANALNKIKFTGTGVTDAADKGVVFAAAGTVDTLYMDQNGTVDGTTEGGTITYGPSVPTGKTLSVRGNTLLTFSNGVQLAGATSALKFSEAAAVSKVTAMTDITAGASNGVMFSNTGGGGSITTVDMSAGNLSIYTGAASTDGGSVNDAINIGAKVLNVYGSGVLTASNKVVLDSAKSKLVFKAAATVSSVEVTSDITTGYGIIFESTGSITALTSTKDFSVDIGAYAITIASINIPSGKDLTLNGTSTLTCTNGITFADNTSSLHINGTLTVSKVVIGTSGGADVRFYTSGWDSITKVNPATGGSYDTTGIFYDAAGTITSIENHATTSSSIIFHVGSAGGTITNDLNLSHANDSVLVFGTGTLTTSVTDGIDLQADGAKLKFKQAATVTNVKVTTADITPGVDKGIVFNANGTISTLAATMNASIDVDTNAATITNAVALGTANKTMYVYGDTGGVHTVRGSLTATAGISLTAATAAIDLKQRVTVSLVKTGTSITPGEANGIIFSDHATITTVDMTTAAGNLSITAKAGFDGIITNELNIGAKTLSFYGNATGELYTTGEIKLNDAVSKLDIAEIGGISEVSITADVDDADGKGIVFTTAGWIDTLSMTATGTVDMTTAGGAINSGPTLPASKTLNIRGTGALTGATSGKYSSPMVATATGCSLNIREALAIDKHVTLASVVGIKTTGITFTDTVTFAGDATINQAGNAVAAFGDVIATTAASVVTDSGTGAITLFANDPKEILLDGDLTFRVDNNASNWAGFDNAKALKHLVTGSTNTSSFVSVPVLTWDGTTNLAEVGTAARVIGIKSDSLMAFKIDASTTTFGGTVYLAHDDTMYVTDVTIGAGDTLMTGASSTGRIFLEYTNSPSIGGVLYSAGSDTFLVVAGASYTTMTFATTGGIHVANGYLKLPGGKNTDVGTNDAYLRVTGGYLMGESNASKNTMVVTGQPSANRELEAGGKLYWLDFDIATTGASQGVNCLDYSSAIWVSVWNKGPTYDGSEQYPWTDIQYAIGLADANAQINVVAGKYEITAPLTISVPIDLRGYKQDRTTAFGGAGVTDDAPELIYTGSALGDSGMILVGCDTVTVQGFKIDLRSSAGATATAGIWTTATDTTTFMNVKSNNFYLDATDAAIEIATSATNMYIEDNNVYGDSGSVFLSITTPATAGIDSGFDVKTNVLRGAQVDLKVNGGNLRDFEFNANTTYDGNGIKLDAAASNTGKFGEIADSSNTYKGHGDYAFYVTSNVTSSDFITNAAADLIVSRDHFYLPAGGDVYTVQNSMTGGTDVAADSIRADLNWWGDVHGPATNTTADYANVSGRVNYNNFMLLPTTIPDNLYVYPITATYYTGQSIPVKVLTSGITNIEFGVEGFDADYPEGPQMVESLTMKTFYVRPWNEAAVSDVRITVSKNGDNAAISYTNAFNIGVGTIDAPTGLVATDQAGDNGGYVNLVFQASLNHTGMTGDADAALPIDYYMVYRAAGTETDIGKAYTWGVITAVSLSNTDTVRQVVGTKGITANGTYWVAAVKGNLPPGVSTSDDATATSKVQEFILIEDVKVAGKSDAEEALNLASEASNANQARGAINYTGANAGFPDFSSDGTVGLDDLSALADNWAVAVGSGNFDPLFDLNNDGEIGLSDLSKLADNWGQTVSNAPSIAVNNGMNTESTLAMEARGDESSEFEIDVNVENVAGLKGYAFSVNYNAEDFEFVGIESSDFLSDDGLTINNSDEPGVVNFAKVIANANEASSANGNGKLATLTFRFIGENNSDILVDGIMLLDFADKFNSLAKTAISQPAPLPVEFALHQNYPNPFNPVTTVKFDLPKSSKVTLVLYNVLGQKVRTLVNKDMRPGFHKVQWDGRNDFGVRVASGMYVYRIQSEGFSGLKKMVLLK